MAKKGEKKIGHRIRNLRLVKGLTQETMADELGMSFGNLGKIERGEIDPNTESLYKIARVLNVEVADLFSDSSLVAEPADKSGFATKDEVKQYLREVENLIRSELSNLRTELKLKKKGYPKKSGRPRK